MNIWDFTEKQDRCVVTLMESIERNFNIDMSSRRDEDGVLHGNWVEGRGTVGEVLRAAVKLGLVSITVEQARYLALSGAAYHDDTADDLYLSAGGVR